MAEDETHQSIEFSLPFPTKTIAFLSGCYAYATTPSFSGVRGAFAAAVTGLGTAFGTMLTTAGGAIGGALGLATLAAIFGAVTNGLHERQAAAQLFDALKAANDPGHNDIVLDGKTGEIVKSGYEAAAREAKKTAFRHGALEGGVVLGFAGGIAGMVFGSVGGFFYGIPASYLATKNLLVHGVEKRLSQPAPVQPPANDNTPGQKLFFDPQKQNGATVQLLTL